MIRHLIRVYSSLLSIGLLPILTVQIFYDSRRDKKYENGTYRNQSESGYSGSDWGTASQGGGNGTWRITGNMNSGTMVTTDNNGKSTTYKFEPALEKNNNTIYSNNYCISSMQQMKHSSLIVWQRIHVCQFISNYCNMKTLLII